MWNSQGPGNYEGKECTLYVFVRYVCVFIRIKENAVQVSDSPIRVDKFHCVSLKRHPVPHLKRLTIMKIRNCSTTSIIIKFQNAPEILVCTCEMRITVLTTDVVMIKYLLIL